ncbi:MAG: hypothetical protein U9N81_03735 [Bacillota bacterium]|nr:hypothetical protein [Bacillota bacterium]
MNNQESCSLQCFNIYYLNFSKVYEILMMIDHVIPSSIECENRNNWERFKKYRVYS